MATMRQTDMIENLGPLNKQVEQISLQAQKALLDLVKRSLDEKQLSNQASAPDINTPGYVKGWRLRLLSLG